MDWLSQPTCKVNTCFQLFGLMSRKGDVDCPAFGFYVFFLIKALVSFKRAYASCCISVKSVSSVQTNWGSRSLHAIGFLCSLFFHLKINTSYSFHSSIFSYQFLWYRCYQLFWYCTSWEFLFASFTWINVSLINCAPGTIRSK